MTKALDDELLRLTNVAKSDVDMTGQVKKDSIAAESAAASPGVQPEQIPVEFQMKGSDLMYMIYSQAAQTIAPNWNLQDDELQTLGYFHGCLVDKYGGQYLAMFGLEVVALYQTAKILGPRIGTPRKLDEKPVQSETEKQKEGEDNE